MSKFTVEEINFMCVFETQDRTDMIGQIRQVMPHIKDRLCWDCFPGSGREYI